MQTDKKHDLLVSALIDLGAGDARHSQRTLIDHLVGTSDLLRKWGNNEDVCLAGLFHSIYGTVYFGTETVDASDRNKIKSLIGDRAEQLAYWFCATNRAELIEQSEYDAPYGGAVKRCGNWLSGFPRFRIIDQKSILVTSAKHHALHFLRCV